MLATGVLDLKMEYYDAKNDLWQTTWDTDAPATIGAFPKAIRVTIQAIDPTIAKDKWKDQSLILMTEFPVLNETETNL